MIAVNLLTNAKFEVYPADKYIKRIIPDAEFYSPNNSYTAAYSPTNIIAEDIENGYRYMYAVINGKVYKLTNTNKYEDLKKRCKSNQQMSIFDFL